METLKELDVILSANDRYELDEFHIKLKRCALAGHNFKICMEIIFAADVSSCDVDSIMSAMRVSANRIEKP
ncbi:MAG: hypothetical protein JRE23_00100 [Deltaproteobacteria bacterium]|nr:hypothetical protein [Deltaproteobacteria bacterium]